MKYSKKNNVTPTFLGIKQFGLTYTKPNFLKNKWRL